MTLLFIMIAVFVVLTFTAKIPRGNALFLAGVVGALVGGYGVPFRDLVEGMFIFFDPLLIVASALLFLRMLEEAGALTVLRTIFLRMTQKSPAAFLIAIVIFLMLPGAMTGLSSSAVLTTGALTAPLLLALGLEKRKTGALIALLAIYGMIAPPINLPVMMLANGVDMPFIGFEKPLLLITVVPAIVTAFGIAYPTLRRALQARGTLLLPEFAEPITQRALFSLLPLVVVALLLVTIRIIPEKLPDPGVPALFLLGTLLAVPFVPTGRKVAATILAYRSTLPVAAILVGIGTFLQILALIGARGDLVVTTLMLPKTYLPLAAAVVMPLFGALSAFGSATVLGVPILLALLGKNEIVVGAALSMFAGLGDMMPPTALAGTFAAEIVGESNYLTLLKPALPWLLVGVVWALAILWYAQPVSRVLGMQ